jgi:hypothetical protein
MRFAVLAFAALCALAMSLPGPAPEREGAADRDARFADLARREAIRVHVADALLRREMTLADAADWFGWLEPEDVAVSGPDRAARRAVVVAARLAAVRPADYPLGRVAELEAELVAVR